MYEFFERLFGYKCCGEFTQWEDVTKNFSRPADLLEPGYVNCESIEFTRRWQERKCTLCGKIQQRPLELYK